MKLYRLTRDVSFLNGTGSPQWSFLISKKDEYNAEIAHEDHWWPWGVEYQHYNAELSFLLHQAMTFYGGKWELGGVFRLLLLTHVLCLWEVQGRKGFGIIYQQHLVLWTLDSYQALKLIFSCTLTFESLVWTCIILVNFCGSSCDLMQVVSFCIYYLLMSMFIVTIPTVIQYWVCF